MKNNLLEIKDLTVRFQSTEGLVTAVNELCLSLERGETLGIVGESGCGKTVSVLAVMGLIPDPPGKVTNGTVNYLGRNLIQLPDREMEKIRGNEITMIFQEPMTSLNPILSCGFQIAEPLMIHKGYSRKDAFDQALKLLKLVGVPSPEQRLREYPHQLSGGLRQRIVIAMALACKPNLLIADEPTTALDATIQAQILELMKELKREINAGIILITHDLGIVAETCDRVAVMYTGRIVEEAAVDELFSHPTHPYTLGLLKSIPRITQEKLRLNVIEGVVPNPTDMPEGCSFRPRCSYADKVCKTQPPEIEMHPGHKVRCWHYEKVNGFGEA